jgi:hypothetical protein
MADTSEVRDMAQAVAEIAKAVPVYQDAIQPAARQIGVALETPIKLVNVALDPIRGLVWGYEQIRDFVSRRVAEKLAHVPPERIQTPLPQVAVPALQALHYTGHDETVRELYANLLATSLDSETARNAHPGFVEIIRSMAPDEGRILKLLSDGFVRPVIEVRALTQDEAGWVTPLKNFSTVASEAGCEHLGLGPAYVDNLVRLGLVEIPPSEALVKVDRYEPLENHPDLLPLKAAILAKGRKVIFERGLMRLTSFGRQFCVACVLEHRETASPDGQPQADAAPAAEAGALQASE